MKVRELITALENIVAEGDAVGRERSYYEALNVRVGRQIAPHAWSMYVIAKAGVALDRDHQAVIVEIRE